MSGNDIQIIVKQRGITLLEETVKPHYDQSGEPDELTSPPTGHNEYLFTVISPNGGRVRKGPGTDYPIISEVPQHTAFVCGTTEYNADGWVWKQIKRSTDNTRSALSGGYIAWFSRRSGTRILMPKHDFVKLDVQWLSQLNVSTARLPNDCGQSCVAMLLNYHNGDNVTPDQVSRREYGLTTATELQSVAREFNLALRMKQISRSNYATVLREKIDNGLPVIVLNHYNQALMHKQVNYQGLHWFLVVGYSVPLDDGTPDVWLVHDPLWNELTQNFNNGGTGGAYLQLFDWNMPDIVDDDWCLF